MELPTHTLLQGGKYRIVRFINSGGFGCTYEAEHVMLEKRVAIKEFFVKDFCNRDEATAHVTVGTLSKKGLVEKLRRKFVDEARAICKLHHPGIVTVSDVFEENGTAYFVMDFIEGRSLSQIVSQEGPLTEEKALYYIRQVADALDYVHMHTRLHLDIKPANIMVDSSDRAILIDFGASKQYDEQDGENTSTLLGKTPGYAPLEQMGNDVTKFFPSTDIYALGATLYKLLTGITPLSATLLASGEELPPLPHSISNLTRQAIAAAMQLNKNHRPQNVGEFLSLFSIPEVGVAEEEDTVVVESVTPQPKPTPQPNPAQKPQPSAKLISTQPSSSWKNWTIPLKAVPWVVGAFFALVLGVVWWIDNRPSYDPNPWVEPIDSDSVEVDSIYYIDEVDSSAIDYDTDYNNVSSTISTGTINGHTYVDLGLSVKWADRNVGASSPSDYGSYFAWGETRTKSEYTVSNNVTHKKNLGNISGNSQYDAARANWGGSWRLPTKAECEELVDKCKWVWTTQGGHNGCKVTGPNGNSIFLPAAGWRNRSSFSLDGEWSSYWTSEPNADYAYYLNSDSGNLNMGHHFRYSGRSVRPVSD